MDQAYRESGKTADVYERQIAKLNERVSYLSRERARPRRWHVAVLSALFASWCALGIGAVVEFAHDRPIAVAAVAILAFWCAMGVAFAIVMTITTADSETKSWLDPWPAEGAKK